MAWFWREWGDTEPCLRAGVCKYLQHWWLQIYLGTGAAIGSRLGIAGHGSRNRPEYRCPLSGPIGLSCSTSAVV
jgi:hypothetical protein